MRTRPIRLLSSATLALALSLVGAPSAQPGRVAETIDAQAATAVTIAMDNIGTQRRGRKDVYVRATTGQAGLICRLSITYADENADSPDDVRSDANGVCIMHFDVPDRKGVVGKAKAKLKVTAAQGSPIGSTKGSFTVKQ